MKPCGWPLRVLALWAFAGSGCLPFALPPVLATASAGSTSERVGTSRRSQFVYDVRGSVHPLQLSPRYYDQEFDVGVGYLFEHVPAKPLFVHGLFVQGDAFLYRQRAGRWMTRGGLRVMPELLFPVNQLEHVGYGGTLAFALEHITFTDQDGARSTNDAVGVAWGSAGIGAFVGPSYRSFGDRSYVAVTGGVAFRVPLVVGAVCCAIPK